MDDNAHGSWSDFNDVGQKAGDPVGVCHSDASATIVAIDFTLGLITRLMPLITDRQDLASFHLELPKLHQTLILNTLAIKAYGPTPLGHSLIYAIIPLVKQCNPVLLELFDKLAGSTSRLASVVGLKWWKDWNRDELVSFRNRLSCVRTKLDGVLMALRQ